MTKKMEKESFIPFTKVQRRLLSTIQARHNQAMNAELNTALLDIYAEMDFDPEAEEGNFRLAGDFSGLELTKVKGVKPDV